LSIFPLQITPALIKSLRAFMARSPERDVINDVARISAVQHSIDIALENLRGEKRGLIRRVRHTVIGQPPADPPGAASMASFQTAPFGQAEQRIRSLDRQIEMFQHIKTLLDEERTLAGR
jgi:hypothetical protein